MAKRHRHLLGPLDVARAKPKAKAYRLADGGGLYLWVPQSGAKVWQFRYRHVAKVLEFTELERRLTALEAK
jgi:Arm domain-containing DNA-binding protein